MDPKRAPDFRPPSTHPEIPPLAPSSQIPKAIPIQPPVLADYPNTLDAPIHPRTHRHHHHHHHHSHNHSQTDPSSAGSLGASTPHSHKSIESTIPMIPENLQPLSSNESSEEEEDVNAVDDASLISSSVPRIQSYQTADLEEVPHGITRQAKTLENYHFPTHRLVQKLKNPNKQPLVIAACGSFSPITYLHLRMFEMAMDAIREQTRFEVIGGYYSPVSDNYKKRGLAPSHHRVRMCELACERTSSWLMVDAWESLQPTYTRTAKVLDHFNEEINVKRGGVLTPDGTKRGVKIMLLAGGDLIESMGEPNVWADEDLHHILGRYGCLIVERTGSDVRSFLLSHDIMYEHRANVLVIKQLIYNDISSTKVRLFIRRGMSVQYLLPNSVIRYIQEYGLYVNEREPVKQVLESKD
ncbi:Nicotinamide/nicotinic acid mononucleotide adenylyltransferase 1 [Cyberlindnera fabianii]|uniref:Nicotinamide-nucleotide adenylyltransferase n=1 Tax=Cyberlindnera fabianii TaxID=36022 RepID=A0A1V2L114_CYBFA|nr:Nicotinamide/nicotinic acid mononucleotide adenylyltransferase 1 [Cyberlindnera fabianii]